MLDDLSPLGSNEKHCSISIDDGAVGAKGSVVETGEQGHAPEWTTEIRFGDRALKPRIDKFLEKRLDSVPIVSSSKLVVASNALSTKCPGLLISDRELDIDSDCHNR